MSGNHTSGQAGSPAEAYDQQNNPDTEDGSDHRNRPEADPEEDPEGKNPGTHPEVDPGDTPDGNPEGTDPGDHPEGRNPAGGTPEAGRTPLGALP